MGVCAVNRAGKMKKNKHQLLKKIIKFEILTLIPSRKKYGKKDNQYLHECKYLLLQAETTINCNIGLFFL